MSQIAMIASPGTVASDIEKLTGDIGGAVGPSLVGLNINLLTGDGLTSTGVPGANTITFTLDNFAIGSGQTIGAVTADLITIPMGAVAGMRIAEAKIEGFEATGPNGCAYNLLCGARTTGAAATIVGIQDQYVAEDASLSPCDVYFTAVANNLIVRALGAAGLTINWKATLTYVGV
jgi:hypothetical protein